MKLQIEKGLFRLWIVFSVIWISVTLIKDWNDYTETRDAYIETWDANIRDAPYFSEIPGTEEEDTQEDRVYTAKDFMPMSKAECNVHKANALSNWKTASIESIPNTLGIAFGVPLLLLIPYYILRWIVKGFIGKQSDRN